MGFVRCFTLGRMLNRSTKGCSKFKVQERMVSTLEQIQVQKGIGPGIRRSKCPLLASCIRCKCSMEASRDLVIEVNVNCQCQKMSIW